MVQIGDLLAQITGELSPTEPTHASTFLPPKRKADEQLRKPVNKIQRTQPPTATLSKPIPNNAPSLSVEGQLSRVKLGSSSQKSTSTSSSTPSATFKNGRPTPPLATEALKAPPKKGSFAEIMARGKAAQSTLGQVGKIQHKKIEKLPSKRERDEMKAQKSSNLTKNLAPGSKFNKPPLSNGRDGRNGVKDNGKKGPPEPEKKIKKAATATTGYAGTARPRPGGTKVPARLSGSASASRYDRGSDRNRYRDERHGSGARYAYVSEDDEEEEDEGREYDSDVSSDMEAAAFEVDEEEELATRIARREDAEALAEENRLKKEKEEKRKRLAALAKSRR
jgi:protein SPT2